MKMKERQRFFDPAFLHFQKYNSVLPTYLAGGGGV